MNENLKIDGSSSDTVLYVKFNVTDKKTLTQTLKDPDIAALSYDSLASWANDCVSVKAFETGELPIVSFAEAYTINTVKTPLEED